MGGQTVWVSGCEMGMVLSCGAKAGRMATEYALEEAAVPLEEAEGTHRGIG